MAGMDTTPIPRTHRDRRITPRRAEDVALHYTRENLLAAADAMVGPTEPRTVATIGGATVGFYGAMRFYGAMPIAIDAMDERYEALRSAVEQYRAAAAAHG